MKAAEDPSRVPPPLRVALFLETLRQPRWICRAIEMIQTSGLATIVLVVRRPRATTSGPSRRSGVLRRLRHAGTSVHSMVDDWLFRREGDVLDPANLEPLLQGVEVLVCLPAPGHDAEMSDSDLRAIGERRLDVAIALGPWPRDRRCAATARYGLWAYRLEPADPGCAGPPGLWEVLRGLPVTESTLESTGGPDGPRILYRSYSATDPFSVRRNRDHACSKAAAFPARVLRDLRDRGALPSTDGDGPPGPRPSQDSRCPGNLQMLLFGARLADKFVRDRMSRLIYDEQWSIALTRGPLPGARDDLVLLRPPRDRSWADPFPVRRGGDLFIFLEEISRATRKGCISVLATDGRGSWDAPVRVLERGHHLAYPFVFEWAGDLFMIPETSANQTVELYRCTKFPERWTLERVLLRHLDASDATLHEIEGRWWMFVNVAAEGAQNTWDELHLYHADSPLGPWNPHRRNPVKSDVRSSRPAGRLFRESGNLMRPAQDCSRRYGHSVVLQRVLRIDPEEYAETPVSTILPDWDPHLLATHTYNRIDELTVLDGLLRRPRFP